MQFALLLSLIIGTVWVTFVSRDTTRVVLYLLGAISLAAVALTAWQRVFGLIPVVLAQVIISVALIGLAIFFRRSKHLASPVAQYAVILPFASLVIAGVLVVARLVTIPENPLLFAGAGRLAYAEDNAKWLNFASNLAQDNLLNFKDGTTGSLAVLLVISGAVAWLASLVFLGGANEPGIAIGAVLGLHAAVIVMAPLMLSPIVTKYFSKSGTRESAHTPVQSLPVVAGIVLALLFVVAAMGAIGTFGHLSLAVVMLQLLFWLAFMIYQWSENQDLPLITLIGASVALTWLPLPPLGIAISLVAVLLAAMRWRKSRTRGNGVSTALLGLLTLILFWLTTPEVTYLSATTLPSTSTDLVFAEGGTMAPNNFELLVFFVTLVGSIAYVWVQRSKLSKGDIWRVYPLVLLFGFSAAVYAYDYLVASDGWPHYGARKLGYLAVVVSTAVLLPIAFQGFQSVTRKTNIAFYSAAGVTIMAFLLSQTFTQASYTTFKRDAWLSLDTRVIDAKKIPDYWVQEVSPQNREQDSMQGYPIACVQVERGVIEPGINDAYFCTRFLLSLHGVESYTNAMFYPVLVAPSDGNIGAMQALPPEILGLDVLVLNSDGNVTGVITVSEYIELYANQDGDLYSAL